MPTVRYATLLTGTGSDDSVDQINGAELAVDDITICANLTDHKTYCYYLDESGDAESSPDVIVPNTNAGNKRHKLFGVYGIASGAVLKTDFNADTFLYAATDDTPAATSPADVMAALSGHAGAEFSFNTQNIGGVKDPTTDQQAATKKYVDSVKRYIQIRLLDKDTSHTTGTGIGGDFRFTKAMHITKVSCYFDTAGTTSVTTIDINEAGTSILSTRLTVDATEKTSETAATAAVISDSAIAANAILTFDIDEIASGTAGKGLTIELEVTIP